MYLIKNERFLLTSSCEEDKGSMLLEITGENFAWGSDSHTLLNFSPNFLKVSRKRAVFLCFLNSVVFSDDVLPVFCDKDFPFL